MALWLCMWWLVLDQLVLVVSGLCCGSRVLSHARCTGAPDQTRISRHAAVSFLWRESWTKTDHRRPAPAVTWDGGSVMKICTTVDSIFDHSLGRVYGSVRQTIPPQSGRWRQNNGNLNKTVYWSDKDVIRFMIPIDQCSIALCCVQIINLSHSSKWT